MELKTPGELNYSPIIYTEKTFYMLHDKPILDDGQIYIYVMKSMPSGNIKIGKTTNIAQRLQSLSGSNGAGGRIIELYCSSSTYIHSLENTAHLHYDFARIKGTEWFDGEKVDFDEVVQYVDGLFHQQGYETCNELRRKIYKKKGNDY